MDRASKCAFVLACAVALSLSFGCSVYDTAAPEDDGRNAGFDPARGTDLELPKDVIYRVPLNHKGSGSVTIENLSGKDVFLVKVNTSNHEKFANIVPSDSIPGEHPVNVPAGDVTIDGQTITRYERHWQGPYPAATVPLTAHSRASIYMNAQTVGDKKYFFVDVSRDNVFTKKSATLKVIGEYCKVWIVDNYFDDKASRDKNDNKINLEQLEALANKFDEIYPLETALLGYEYGGGPSGNGGVDGDPKIQILVFDIDGDAKDNTRTGMTLGYFYQVDEYTRTDNPHSNEAEIFYLDSEALDKMPDTIYSTLIHEFNHMINFNIKVIQTGSRVIDAWYTEMLSMLAEDAIGPLVGIQYNGSDNGNVITTRIRSWLSCHASTSVMYWTNSINSYAANYAFGAYLVRNFGGPELLSDMAKSPLSGKDSLDASLRKINGQNKGVNYALYRFGEVLVYSGEEMPADVFSFDKTTSATIGKNEYTFPRFNIWEMHNSNGIEGKGPIVSRYETEQNITIPPNAVQLFSCEDWPPASGPLTIQVQNGSNAVIYYVMVK